MTDIFNGTSAKDPTETADNTDAHMAPAEPDFNVYELSLEPVLQRLQALSSRQNELMNEHWTRNSWGPLGDLDWPKTREVCVALTAIESDTAIKDALDDFAERLGIAEKLAAVDIEDRHWYITAFSNYGVDHFTSPNLTAGQCICVEWVLDHPNPAWFTGQAATLVEEGRTFSDRLIEQERTAAAEVEKAKADKALEEGYLDVDPDQPAPADWDAPVPEGKTLDIEEWIQAPLNREPPATEEHFERAHRAMTAEIRRRGAKQRKTVVNMCRKKMPLQYVPPYLRVDPPTADEPAFPTSFDMHTLLNGESINIVINKNGVSFWKELADDSSE